MRPHRALTAAAVVLAAAGPIRAAADDVPRPHEFPTDVVFWSPGSGGFTGYDRDLVPLTASSGSWTSALDRCSAWSVEGSVTLAFDTRVGADLGTGSTVPATAFVDAWSFGSGGVEITACELDADPESGAVTVRDAVPVAAARFYPGLRVAVAADLVPADLFTSTRAFLLFRFDEVSLGTHEARSGDLPCGLAIGLSAAPHVPVVCALEVVLSAPDDLAPADRAAPPPGFSWTVRGPEGRGSATLEWSTDPLFRGAHVRRVRRAMDAAALADGTVTPSRRAWRRLAATARSRGTVYWRVRIKYRWRVPAHEEWMCFPFGPCWWGRVPAHWEHERRRSPTRRLVGA